MFRRSLLLLLLASPAFAQPKDVDFNRDIRPILSGKCFQCHGPDDKARQAGLRFDLRDAALKPLKSGDRAIVPGDSAKSELIARISVKDGDGVMPPSKTGKTLTETEIAMFKRWIDQGAKYAVHWSYAKPVRAAMPPVHDAKWPQTPIDYFILARLEKEGLTPAAPADRYALIRRLTLDLTGLPPTPDEADAFAKDASPDAYEKLVDRLLKSKAYGERWAQVWLDLARYADSQGFANDPDRTIWRWRDWLIESLNDNLPFDQLTIQMLAGDLLPNPTPAQLIATGFHRNTLTNTEGGTSVEEFRSAAVVDRVNTTMQVWLGTTINCCQCHNHKYDPLTQKEFYQLYAIFNATEDRNAGDDFPTVQTAITGKDREFTEANAKLAAEKKKYDDLTKTLDAAVGRAMPEILKILPDQAVKMANRDGKFKDRVAAQYRSRSPDWVKLDAAVRELTNQVKLISTSVPVLREGKPRETHIHIRGNYLDKGERVTPGLPAVFPQPPKGEPMNRLTLAKWLVAPDHPLTARVAVNRLWEELFGTGIVETSEDFGMQGDPPSHPELLDWLATEYIRLGWDTKKMLKLLVTSAAYRQSSAISDSKADPKSEIRNPKLDKDPFNRLISHGPRVRLSAEEVRDQALFVSGLLSPKMYGPPVQPLKPNFGLSAAFGGSTDWQASAGEDKYRRGLYIRIRRNAPYPSMATFDAPERTSCNIRRIRTNTPLQALVTLNDPVYIEAAQALARRMAAAPGTNAQKAAFGFRLTLTRPPTERETQRLVDLFQKSRNMYCKSIDKATAMATKPLGPAPKGIDVAELAAWTVVGNVLLNLDETLAKP